MDNDNLVLFYQINGVLTIIRLCTHKTGSNFDFHSLNWLLVGCLSQLYPVHYFINYVSGHQIMGLSFLNIVSALVNYVSHMHSTVCSYLDLEQDMELTFG